MRVKYKITIKTHPKALAAFVGAVFGCGGAWDAGPFKRLGRVREMDTIIQVAPDKIEVFTEKMGAYLVWGPRYASPTRLTRGSIVAVYGCPEDEIKAREGGRERRNGAGPMAQVSEDP